MQNHAVAERVAINVRAQRRHLNLGLAELSERVTAAGHPLSLKTLSKIETGLRGISVEDLCALASALGVSVDDLLTDPALRELEQQAKVAMTAFGKTMVRLRDYAATNGMAI